MRLTILFMISGLAIMAPAKLLIDYNAARDDDVSEMGQLNLEKERKDKPKSNSKDLYIKMDTDWRGTKCAHFHRKKDYIRYAW